MARYDFHKPGNDPQQWYWFQNALTKEEVKQIIDMAEALPIHRATTINSDGNQVEQNDPNGVRSSMVKWIPQAQNWDWLYEKMKAWAEEANGALWNFNLVSCLENIQYTEYYAHENGHYDWHQDIGPGDLPSKRKVSITVQLSDSDEYEGGELQITHGGYGDGEFGEVDCPRGSGVAVLFPSYMMHRVSPVKKGTRRSLVLWVGGEQFK